MICPICEKASLETYNPFCSKRCADVDLGKWLTGAYTVASTDEDDEIELEQALENKAKKSH